jgi:formylglycine-generating enzyme required for sulfatase activity/outer membrane protein OmpA-like peptidoglycan-associated protein
MDGKPFLFTLFLTTLLAVTILTSGCDTLSKSGPQQASHPLPDHQPLPYQHQAMPQRYTPQTNDLTPKQDRVSAAASQFATSYNQAVRDKDALNMAAMNNDHARSQELIRSYTRNMALSQDSYKTLKEIAENQGTGVITIFFPHNASVLDETSRQYDRLIRYLDSLERNNRNRGLVFVLMGSASAVGEDNYNQALSKRRAEAPIPVIDQYLVNVPHVYHKVYGTGEANSPETNVEDVNKRYRFVRIMALYTNQASETGAPMMPSGDRGQPYLGRMGDNGMQRMGQGAAEYINPVGMKFIRVPAGSFMMGSPDTEIQRDKNEILHQVTITQDYYLQATEVTQQQWLDVMGTQPSHFKNCGMDCPVENVRYSDVMAFIKNLNEMEHTTHYRLPTEAEWEYACRSGSGSAFFNGPMIQEGDNNRNPYLDVMGWYYHNASHAPHRVALKSPNAWGFYDMHGNVWEWCSDWHRPYPFYAEIDPKGAVSAKAKIRRGGSWAHYPSYCRSAYRSWYDPEDNSPELGFRVAITRLERNAIPQMPMVPQTQLPPAPKPPPKPAPAPIPKAPPKPKLPPEPVPMPGPAEITQCILIRDITFDLDSARINTRMAPLLDRAVELLKKYDGKIELNGHTCSLGTKHYNMGLGRRRADAVKAYLVSKGIPANRITTQSFGEENPKFTNRTDAGRSLNRRVEILLHGFTDGFFKDE